MKIIFAILIFSAAAHATIVAEHPIHLLTVSSQFDHADLASDSPEISILSASEPGTNLLVVEWPDGVVNKLKYTKGESNLDSLGKWLEDRAKDYEIRKKAANKKKEAKSREIEYDK